MPTTFIEIQAIINSYFPMGFIGVSVSEFTEEEIASMDVVLEQQIITSNLSYGYGYSGSTGNYVFNDDLTSQQKLLLALRSAIRIASGFPEEFSYKSPILATVRKGLRSELLVSLRDELLRAEQGNVTIAMDVRSGLDAMIESDCLFSELGYE